MSPDAFLSKQHLRTKATLIACVQVKERTSIDFLLRNRYSLFLRVNQGHICLRQELLGDSGWSAAHAQINMVFSMDSVEMRCQRVGCYGKPTFSADQDLPFCLIHNKIHN
jgi:hypothetical protein